MHSYTSPYLKVDADPWTEWFAWQPVLTEGYQWVWLQKIYRRRRQGWSNERRPYQFATFIDLLSK